MHGVLITFKSSAPLDDLKEPFTAYAQALRGVRGLVSKTWLRDGDALGGFHVFTSREDADAYLSSDMVAGLTANPAFADFEIRHYDILDPFSAITGTPRSPLAQ